MGEVREIFEKDGKVIILTRVIGETSDEFFHRGGFILRNLGKGTMKDVINKSFLFVNIFIKKNGYGEEILKKFQKKYDCSLC